ncbi:MAG: rhodanese-like domain-containing protein [Dehalococcoidia bacterium]|nr:rhodanese-like domain-containing protein [Dehalococcoidia bacterium]
MQSPDEPFIRVTSEQAQELIASGKVRIVDVREPSEYARDHLANATLTPLGSILANPARLGTEGGILFVCEMGQRSAVAAEAAAAIGLTDLYNLEGGMASWRGKGLPVEK